MLINYGRYLVYSILEALSAIINLCMAVVGLRPNLSWGINWLSWLESKRVKHELLNHLKKKDERLKKADKDMEYVKETLNGPLMEE